MPVLKQSAYPNPPFFLFNGHLQTFYPALTRKVEVEYERERLELDDGDFLDLDWIDSGSRNLVILSHGLEGGSSRYYIKGMARFFAEQDWDILAWHCRSCSEEINRNPRLYNHGEIEDIETVIHHALRTKDYEQIVLIGFSMGGSISMKYLGAHGKEVPDPITKGIAISSPCDMEATIEHLQLPKNRFFKRYFRKGLEEKIRRKAEQFPELIDVSKFDEIKTWRDFDNWFTAPLNGYEDADDFYQKASCKNYMSGTSVPILLINAYNDPVLSPADYPREICEKHPLLFLETPAQGGHVGFHMKRKPYAWTEYRAMEFVYA